MWPVPTASKNSEIEFCSIHRKSTLADARGVFESGHQSNSVALSVQWSRPADFGRDQSVATIGRALEANRPLPRQCISELAECVAAVPP
jgi:hypothetical protein